MKKIKDCNILIFGASGDLTKRKLIPSLYELYKKKMLPENFSIIGISRTDMNSDSFRKYIKRNISEADINFLQHLYYFRMDNNYTGLKEKIINVAPKIKNYIFYLATPPQMISKISDILGREELTNEEDGYKRVIVEKPFGWDYTSAIEINSKLHLAFKEEQIYRIDHYLGKETVQNILVTRFSNGIFEPLWNRRYIDHIEISSVESLGIEGRGKYYDNAGALRDMMQNHLLHLMSFIAMEPPSSLDSNSIRNEILKVLQSLRPLKEKSIEKNVIRGQYISSKIRGNKVLGYREEPDVNPKSMTETYVAMKFYIDNWRWGGVPFYIRTGKRLPTRVTEAVINFKETPHYLFKNKKDICDCNQLIIRIQPDEGLLLKIDMKKPGAGYEVKNVNMDFHYKELSEEKLPEAYERLLYDCLIGDSTLYTRADAVESSWKFLEPIQNAWKNKPEIKMYGYPAGTWGPENADDLIEGKNMKWRYPCKNLSNDGNYCEL